MSDGVLFEGKKVGDLTEAEFQQWYGLRQQKLCGELLERHNDLVHEGPYAAEEMLQAQVFVLAKVAFDSFNGSKSRGMQLRKELHGMFWDQYMGLHRAHERAGRSISDESLVQVVRNPLPEAVGNVVKGDFGGKG